ncbi:MAG: hypothetical protein SFV32_08720 [Opitutaceae bacterium]|nr:hypothetical protein [Opitutaceae bacterium]
MHQGKGVVRTFVVVLCVLAATCLTPRAQAQTEFVVRHEKSAGAFLWGVAEGDAGMVAVGSGGTLLTSGDGLKWSQVETGTKKALLAVTVDDKGQYVVVGESGTILLSTDGAAWRKAKSVPSTARLNNIVFSEGKYVAVGEAGVILYSEDGETWSSTDSGVKGWLRALMRHAGFWIAGGEKDALVVSRDGKIWKSFTLYWEIESDIEVLVPAPKASWDTGADSFAFLAAGQNGTIGFGRCYWYGDPETMGAYAMVVRYPAEGAARIRVMNPTPAGFLAGGEGGMVLTIDGQVFQYPFPVWSELESSTHANLTASATGLRSLWLVGENETIVQSDQFLQARLGNISTRGVAGKHGQPMLAGMVVTGEQTRKFLIRGAGPALKPFGVSGTMEKPMLELFRDGTQLLASNKGWSTNLNPASVAETANQVGAFAFSEGSADCAMSVTLEPGTYIVQLTGADKSSGVGLVEVYDTSEWTETATRLYNLSTLGYVGRDSETMVAGFVIQGVTSRRVVIRGVGPTLSQFSVPNPLADPVIKLYRGQERIAENDDWATGGTFVGRTVTAEEVRDNMKTSGGFALPVDSKDAVIVATLRPGNYTVTVEGKNGGTGNAIVEVYELPGY